MEFLNIRLDNSRLKINLNLRKKLEKTKSARERKKKFLTKFKKLKFQRKIKLNRFEKKKLEENLNEFNSESLYKKIVVKKTNWRSYSSLPSTNFNCRYCAVVQWLDVFQCKNPHRFIIYLIDNCEILLAMSLSSGYLADGFRTVWVG